jgi:hypothetical protein
MGQNQPLNQTARGSGGTIAFERLFDWILGAVLGIGGLLTSFIGSVVYGATERAEISRLVRDSEFQSEVLTETEAIDAIVALGRWGSIGLVATGILVALVGVAVVVVHGRVRERGADTPRWILGVAGATVATVLGFVPFSPVLGGAAASYMNPSERSSGVAVGAIAGLLSVLPLFAIAAFAAAGLFTGLVGEVAATVGLVLVVGLLLTTVYTVGLSALGGYLGDWLR